MVHITHDAIPNSSGGVDGLTCSGPNRGVCENGNCICAQPNTTGMVVFGGACECDNFRCPRDVFGRICSGKSYIIDYGE